MSTPTFVATILGIPHIPTVIEVNVRSGPSISRELVFKTPLRVQCTVKDVQPDADKSGKDGKTYQWFHLTFPDGRSGWARDDLIEIEGDGSAFGYGLVNPRQQGFLLTRKTAAAVTTSPAPTVSTPPATTTTPPAPAVSTPPALTTTPATTTPASGTTFTAGQASAIAINKSGTRIRSGSGVGHAQVGSIPYLGTATILGARPEDNNASRYKWINVSYQGVNGWAREDYLRVEGDRTAFGLGSNDYYVSPMDRCWWVRDFNMDGNAGIVHWGWDLGAETGEPIYSGPGGGTVVRVFRCTKCTPDRPNTPSHGFSIGDSRIVSDAGWGFGYGHFVTVRYDHHTLPAATKQVLASRGIPGAHIFALYAHLHTIDCAEGQVLAPRTRFASCGNTGNSEATHLHLEIRASTNPNEQWSNMMKNLLDPTVLYVR